MGSRLIKSVSDTSRRWALEDMDPMICLHAYWSHCLSRTSITHCSVCPALLGHSKKKQAFVFDITPWGPLLKSYVQ